MDIFSIFNALSIIYVIVAFVIVILEGFFHSIPIKCLKNKRVAKEKIALIITFFMLISTIWAYNRNVAHEKRIDVENEKAVIDQLVAEIDLNLDVMADFQNKSSHLMESSEFFPKLYYLSLFEIASQKLFINDPELNKAILLLYSSMSTQNLEIISFYQRDFINLHPENYPLFVKLKKEIVVAINSHIKKIKPLLVQLRTELIKYRNSLN